MQVHDNPQQASSATGELIQNVAGAADPTRTTLRRVGETVAAVKVGSRLLPATWRFMKRHPVNATLLIVGVASAIYLTRASTHRTAHVQNA